MSINGEPKRYQPTVNIDLLDENEREKYNLWYKAQFKDNSEKIPNDELVRQMRHEPYYDFDSASTIFASRDMNGNFIAGGTVLGCTLPNGKRFGELAGVYVVPTARKTGIATQIDKKREEWCKDKFEWLQTHIASTNIPSLRLKFKHGYVLKDVSGHFSEKGSCLLVKKIKESNEQTDQTQIITIPLTDLKSLEQHTRNGWEGTELIPVEPEENIDQKKWLSPNNWLVTLRKI